MYQRLNLAFICRGIQTDQEPLYASPTTDPRYGFPGRHGYDILTANALRCRRVHVTPLNTELTACGESRGFEERLG